jgi:hypothetical protein
MSSSTKGPAAKLPLIIENCCDGADIRKITTLRVRTMNGYPYKEISNIEYFCKECNKKLETRLG